MQVDKIDTSKCDFVRTRSANHGENKECFVMKVLRTYFFKSLQCWSYSVHFLHGLMSNTLVTKDPESKKKKAGHFLNNWHNNGL